MQVDPIKPKLKPTATKCLKLKCAILLSTAALKFNLRRYNKADFVTRIHAAHASGRGSHSFPFQLNLSSSVHRIIQHNS